MRGAVPTGVGRTNGKSQAVGAACAHGLQQRGALSPTLSCKTPTVPVILPKASTSLRNVRTVDADCPSRSSPAVSGTMNTM